MNYSQIISNDIGEESQTYFSDEQKVRVFLEWYREHNPNTIYGYLRLFVSAFTFNLNQNQTFDFTENYEFRIYLKGLKREMLGGSSKNAKSYITPAILMSLAPNVKLNNNKSIQLMTIYSLCYYGLLKISECLNIRKKEIIKDEEGKIVLMIPVSKTDQTGRRVQVSIVNSNTNYSPFQWLELWFSSNNFSSDDFIFNITERSVRYNLKKQ